MTKFLYSLIGIIIPLIGTSIGSMFVFFMKKNISSKINKLMIGFSIGVMLASSIFSLIIPAIELSSVPFISVTIGFCFGYIILIMINKLTSKNKKLDMLSFSVTLHNIPEGMAVGVCFASYLVGNKITLVGALVFAIGIAIQNIPEGSIISIPIYNKGYSKFKSFIYGVLSGVVEPISGFITLILINYVMPMLPYFLSFASGAMIYVIFSELTHEIDDDKNCYGLFGLLIGFILMMVLDIVS